MACSDNWRNRSSVGWGSKEVHSADDRANILFFYNSRKKVSEPLDGIICAETESLSRGATFVENTRAGNTFVKKIKSKQANSDSTYQAFHDFLNRCKQNTKAIKLTHPNYGITQLIISALSDEEPQVDAKIGFVLNNSAFRQCLRDAYEAGATSNETSFKDFMSGMSQHQHLPVEMNALNTDHLDEVTAAQADLPKMGVVTTIVSFEDYLYDLLSRVFDQVYGQVRSVNDLLNILKSDTGKKNDERSRRSNSPSDIPNLVRFWLQKSKPLTEELTRKFKFFLSPASSLEHDNSELTVDQMYAVLQSNPDKFVAFVQTVLPDYKNHCLKAISTNITVDSLAQVVERIASRNYETSTQSSQMFTNVLNEIIQNNEEYYGMIMQVGFDADKSHQNFKFGLNSENITTEIGLPANDHINKCVHFRVNNRGSMYRYLLSKEDKEEIRNTFREYDGWQIWINKETRYTIKVEDVQTLDNLIRLFCGIKNLFSQGRSEKLWRSGQVLDEIPSCLKLLAIKKTINPSNEEVTESFYNHLLSPEEAALAASECENHLLAVWKKALKDGNTFTVDYYLYFTIAKFFTYLALHVGRAVTCSTWILAQKKQSSKFGMDEKDLDQISRGL